MKRGVLILALFWSGCLFSSSGDDFDKGRDVGADAGDMASDLNESDGTGGRCGDGSLQADEACDPNLPADSPGACPESCDDGEACTIDTLVGAAETCDAACSVTVITACQNNDGCCPSDCTASNDSDCDGDAVCGDGLLAEAETCDPGITSGEGVCPVIDSCEVDMCERPRVVGSRTTCDAECSGLPISLCVDDDGCCAPGCDTANDDDCMVGCMNGIIDPGETCDGNCPTSCDDGNPCTDDMLVGDASTCDATCVFTPISACVAGDMCCPSNCTNANDADCSATCGNGVVDPTETCEDNTSTPCPASCDDGDACTNDTSTGSPANCNVTCNNDAITACVNEDGCCPSACTANNDNDCNPLCGNSVTEEGETCDGNCPTSCDDGAACTVDSLVGSPDACTAECQYTDVTACIDGDNCCPDSCNANNDDDCGAICGNDVQEPGEICDGDCPTTCNDGDACTLDVSSGTAAMCNRECMNSPINSCVDGDGCCPANCNSTNDDDCSADCGNGIVEGMETCDGDCPTLQMCRQQLGTCGTIVGNPASCTAVCALLTGCVGCNLNGSCPCPDAQVCANGRCVQSSGNNCALACKPDKYCGVHGPGDTCSQNTCVDCANTQDCAFNEMCEEDLCIPADSCNAAANPDQYCAAQMLGYTCDMSTGTCRNSCSSTTGCGPFETCLAGWCVPASNCSEARDPEGFCGAEQTCVNAECRSICFQPPTNCDCTLNQSCSSSVPSHCTNTPPTHCNQICPSNGLPNTWCQQKHGTGWYCGVGGMAAPDGCAFGGSTGDVGIPDMGPVNDLGSGLGG